jgi:excisionase family DNA binding protein
MIQEAAVMLQVSYARSTELARMGLLPVVRLGRQIRVNPDELQKWIEAGGQKLPGNWRRSA